MGNSESAFSKEDTAKVKGLAIIAMMIHHCFLNAQRYEGQIVSFTPFSEGALNAFALAMKICVAMFTFVSAYGITLSFKRQSPEYSFTGKEAGVILKRRLISLLGGYGFVFILVQLWDLIIVRDGRYYKIYGYGLRSILYFLIDLSGLAEMFSTPTYLATFWYMSLAISLILLMPLLLKLYKSTGPLTLLFCAALFKVLFPASKNHVFMYLPDYLFCITMGIVTADTNLVLKMKHIRPGSGRKENPAVWSLAAFFLTALLVFIRQKTRTTSLLPVWDGFIPLLICFWLPIWGNALRFIGKPLEILGKYSMNIFLIHNFIRIVWYYDFTYRFRMWWLITLVLLALSFLLSVLIEQLKKLLRYQNLLAFLTRKAVSM